jgi:hypothetical protein
VTSSEEDTDINSQNICDDSKDVETETDCEKCFICEESDIDVQVVVFGHTLNVVYGNFQMATFVTRV